MNSIQDLKVKIYADGADLTTMLKMAKSSTISGLTTNPTLMRKAGVNNYKAFASEVLQEITTKPISFEVFSDDFSEMYRQAIEIASWGSNVFVKIPVMNTLRDNAYSLIRKLSNEGVKLNVTALMTLSQVKAVYAELDKTVPSYISIFAGRIADTGVDPIPMMNDAVECVKGSSNVELIWASPRELLNIFQADQTGCHIITVTSDLLKKMSMVGYDLEEYSLDTVKMFHRDAQLSGFDV